MAQAADRPGTIEDLYALPDDGLRHELSRGRMIAEPPPGGGHGRVSARIVQLLANYVDRHENGVILTCDPGFILARRPDTVRAPDVAFVALSRYRTLRDDQGLLPLAPDLAVEVLSPSDRPGAVAAKLADYFGAETKLVWLVNPRVREVTIHEPGAAPVRLSASTMLTAPGVLPGFDVRVAELFRSPLD